MSDIFDSVSVGLVVCPSVALPATHSDPRFEVHGACVLENDKMKCT